MKHSPWYIKLPLITWLGSMVVSALLLASYAFVGDNPESRETISSLYIPTILIGIMAFCLFVWGMIIKKFIDSVFDKKGKLNRKKLFKYPAVLILAIFIISLLTGSVLAAKNISNGRFKSFFNSTTSSPIPKVDTLAPTSNPGNNNLDTDPIITCSIHEKCGGGSKQLKQSVCNNMICCFYDSKCGGPKFVYKSECGQSVTCCGLSDGSWKTMKVDECNKLHNSYKSNNNGSTYTYSNSNYPPCTIYYPALKYSQTYSYTSPEQCQQWKNNVNSSTTSTYTPIPQATYSTPAPTPQPTTDPALCSQAVAMWNSYKENFDESKYSSSYEAVLALDAERQIIQNELYSYGCTNKISI